MSSGGGAFGSTYNCTLQPPELMQCTLHERNLFHFVYVCVFVYLLLPVLSSILLCHWQAKWARATGKLSGSVPLASQVDISGGGVSELLAVTNSLTH